MRTCKKKSWDKLRDIRAFTLAEALIAVIILILVSAVVAAGIPAARTAYEKVVLSSNSQVLLSTTMSTLRNELLTATDIEVKNSGKELEYISETLGTRSMISKADGSTSDSAGTIPAGTIMIKRDTNDSSPAERLVSGEASDKDLDLYVTFDTVQYIEENKKTIIKFHNVEVKKGDSTKAIREYYSIPVITVPREDGQNNGE